MSAFRVLTISTGCWNFDESCHVDERRHGPYKHDACSDFSFSYLVRVGLTGKGPTILEDLPPRSLTSAIPLARDTTFDEEAEAGRIIGFAVFGRKTRRIANESR